VSFLSNDREVKGNKTAKDKAMHKGDTKAKNK
jgi:hypothetical protein